MTVDKQTSCILWGAERKPPTLILWNALSLWDERTNTELKTVGDISQQKLAFLFLSITLNGICSFPLGLHQGGMSAFPPEGLFLHNHINPIALASRIQYITSHYHLGFARHQWIQLNCATRQKEKKKSETATWIETDTNEKSTILLLHVAGYRSWLSLCSDPIQSLSKSCYVQGYIFFPWLIQ